MMNAAEGPEQFGGEPSGIARRWIAEIQGALKGESAWRARGGKVVRRYLDERPDALQSLRRMNLLWANVETLKPALYARLPVPEVSRRFKDRDPVGRVASEILERALSACMDLYDADAVARACVLDSLLPGRGQMWVRYATGQDGYERVIWDYVPWRDFLHQPARTWEEVGWVARRVYLTRDELRALTPEQADRVPLDVRPAGMKDEECSTPEGQVFAKASVWEIWTKRGEVIHIHTGYGDAPLRVVRAPLDLSGRFPCPRPILSTHSTDSLIPVPDFAQYQDQADEIDDLTQRIGLLQDALKVVGVYDSSAKELANLLGSGVENVMVPVDSWAAFAEKGGLNGSVSFLPTEQIANTLIQLYEARERAKQALYEITGISDIIRGASQANETATAQSIKAQWGSIRVRDRQTEVQRFLRDALRIKAEFMAELFDPVNLAMMAGAEQMDAQAQQLLPQALMLLRDDRLRSFRIDIETDSTVQADEDAEKQRRVEFLDAVGGFMERSLGAVIQAPQVAPALLPALSEMVLFAARGFRAGRQLEGVIEQSFQQMGEQLAQAQQQQQQMAQQQAQAAAQPSPVEMAKIETERAKIQLDAQKAQGEFALGQADLQLRAEELRQQAVTSAAAMVADPNPQVMM